MMHGRFDQNVLTSIVIGLLVVGRFLLRELRERRFLVARIYLLPIVLGIVAVVLIVVAVVTRPEIVTLVGLACAAALVLGAAIGYGVAHNTTVRVTDDASVLYARGSYMTVIIWLAALAIRLLARIPLLSTPSLSMRWSEALNAALLVLLASAMFFVRYRLLIAARAERSRGTALAAPAI